MRSWMYCLTHRQCYRFCQRRYEYRKSYGCRTKVSATTIQYIILSSDAGKNVTETQCRQSVAPKFRSCMKAVALYYKVCRLRSLISLSTVYDTFILFRSVTAVRLGTER